MSLFLYLLNIKQAQKQIQTTIIKLKKIFEEGAMINIKNILKVLVIALFVCVWSGDVWALNDNETDSRYSQNERRADVENNKRCNPVCGEGQNCVNGTCQGVKASGGGGINSSDFCNSDFGIFKDLIRTGRTIFNRLRDLIYVVAGFGIIAVAVGGFFGNLNWKWLGAIVISLVVIATAGELIVLMTGCESFGSALITNTLTNENTMSTADYNNAAMDEYRGAGQRINWEGNDDKDTGWTFGRDSASGGDASGGASGEGALPEEGDLP